MGGHGSILDAISNPPEADWSPPWADWALGSNPYDPPEADLRFEAHKNDRIRWVIPQRGKPRVRLNIEPKDFFETASSNKRGPA